MSFSFRNFLICTFVSGFMFSLTGILHGKNSQAPQCSPEMLDVNVLTAVESPTESSANWLAVEIQNRTQAACQLSGLAVRFPPDEDEWKLNPDSSQTSLAANFESKRLESKEVVHFLLAWSSIPTPVNGVVMDDCTTHDVMTLSRWLTDQKPFLEVQHLWMRNCGLFWRSSYHSGPYVPGESVGKELLERFHLREADFPPLAAGESLKTILASGPAATLRTLDDVEYLPGTFESGYSGYFELLLKLPSPAISNCPFHSLRKREADGETRIYLDHCDSHGAQLPHQPGTKETRLLIREMGLLPERPGRVEYDAVSEVLQDGKHALAHAQTELSIRDPKQPMLPVIDTSIPGCQASRLQLTTAPVELGNHWGEPRAYAPPGEEWHDGKVFEVTNVSGQSCMLGGVPDLKLLNPPEMKSGFLTPGVCRNCATPLFSPRESRWIELKPNGSAHFMVARSVFDPDYWFQCTVIGGLEMKLPGDNQPIRLPFEAANCRRLRVSAWRAGRYDADPMNIQYYENLAKREQQRVAGQPLPKEFAENMSEDTGRPVVFPSCGPLIWGLSTKPTPYGKEIRVLLWLYNPTDKPQPVWTCMGIDFFWLLGIDVFDSAGQRVLGRSEEKERNDPRRPVIMGCTRNFPINIPPHTCVHGSFSKPDYDFTRDLGEYYSLPPGRYFIVPGERGPDYRPVTRTLPDPSIGLELTVLQE